MGNNIIDIAKQKAMQYTYKERTITRSVYPQEADIVQDYLRGFIAGYGEAIKINNKQKNENDKP